MNRPCLSALAALFLSGAPACTDLTEPVSMSGHPVQRPAATAAPAPSPAPAPAPNPSPTMQAPQELAAASHILIAYQGAMRAAPTITRTKDEARKKAEDLIIRARKGEDFAKLADENSDDPSAKSNHGALGRFPRDRMVKPFADATFAMKPGELSAIVETPFGFHIIKRTE